MFVSYLLQYLDKTAMSYTSILGLLPGTVRCRYVFFDTIQAVVSDFNIAHEHRAVLMGLQRVLLRLHGRILSRIHRICQVSHREVSVNHDVSSVLNIS